MENEQFPDLTLVYEVNIVENTSSIVESFVANYNSSTTDILVSFTLLSDADVSFEIRDAEGNNTILNITSLSSGNHSFSYNVTDFSVGSYVFRMVVNNNEVLTQNFIITSINEPSNVTHFNISPNPNTGNAVISFTLLDNADVTLEIYDMSGTIFYTKTNFYLSGEHTESFDVSEFPNGSYICRMFIGGVSVATGQFILSR